MGFSLSTLTSIRSYSHYDAPRGSSSCNFSLFHSFLAISGHFRPYQKSHSERSEKKVKKRFFGENGKKLLQKFPWGCQSPQNGHFWGSMFCSLFFSDRSKWDFWGGQKCTKMEFSDPMSPCAHGSDKNKEPAETLISEVGVFSVDFREPRQTLYCFSKVKLNDGDDWALNIYDDDTMYPPATRWQRYWIVDKTSLEM